MSPKYIFIGLGGAVAIVVVALLAGYLASDRFTEPPDGSAIFTPENARPRNAEVLDSIPAMESTQVPKAGDDPAPQNPFDGSGNDNADIKDFANPDANPTSQPQK